MTEENGFLINEGKRETIEVGGVSYRRLAVQTHVITDADDIVEVAKRYLGHLIESPEDIAIFSEKAVACTQRRAIKMSDIHPRPLARLLCKFVLKTQYGIGLGIPETMEMALQECGTIRILFAAFISAIGKLFRRRGWFYAIAGPKARGIDGPCDYTLPPYNEYVVLIPDDPDGTAKKLAKALGCKVAIIDANDLEVQILGTSDPAMDRDFLCDLIRDNPLGQTDERTPLGIIRRA